MQRLSYMRALRQDFEFSYVASGEVRRHPPLAAVAAFPLAALVAFVSWMGISSSSIYARETPNWAAQAIGQDWVDLLLAVPWLLVTGALAVRGSRRALLLLAGGFLYTFYEFVIYAFAIHFNALFLAYCATLGVSFFALAGIALELASEDATAWLSSQAPTRTAGILLIAIGGLFGLAWLGDVTTALWLRSTPPSVVDAGVPTNPVHVIDLSIVLPLHIVAGIALIRRHKLGYALSPIILAFGVLMASSIGGMMLVMRQKGFDSGLWLVSTMAFVAAACAAVLGLLLRRYADVPAGRWS